MGKNMTSGRQKLLIIESEPLLRKYILSCIQPLDLFDIFEVGNPVEAIETVRQQLPLVIIFDLKNIPDKTFELIRESRTLNSNYLPFFIALSATRDDVSILEAFQYGADYFLSKNFSRHELAGILKNILRLDDFKDKLETKEKYYRTIFQMARDPLFLIHASDLTLIDFNEAAASLFKSYELGKTSFRFTELFTNSDQIAQLITKKTTYASLLRSKQKDGTSFPVSAAVNYFDAQDMMLVSLKDLSLEMRLNEEMLALYAARNQSGKKENFKEMLAFLAGEENERRRISREIHDHVGQLMVSVKLQLESILQHEEGVQKAGLTDVRNQLIDAISALRLLSSEVASDSIPGNDLMAAIRSLLDTFESKHGLEIKAALPKSLPYLTSFVQTNFFRIIEESLVNVLKHAGSPKVVFSIVAEQAKIHFYIENQGDFQINKSGMGLRIMQQRAILIGGELFFESDANALFRLNCWLPFDHENEEKPTTTFNH